MLIKYFQFFCDIKVYQIDEIIGCSRLNSQTGPKSKIANSTTTKKIWLTKVKNKRENDKKLGEHAINQMCCCRRW